jgi:hypothetical protein
MYQIPEKEMADYESIFMIRPRHEKKKVEEEERVATTLKPKDHANTGRFLKRCHP